MKQTIKELAQLIDTEGVYNVSRDMWIRVRVEDVRVAYGETQLLITPVAGTGSTWVLASNVKAG
jgi:hypothetical protein